MSASVFFSLSEASSLNRRQSGRMEEKIWACLTCPAMMTSSMPSRLRMSMSRLSSPSEIQWQREARGSMSGEASSLMPMTTTS